MECKYKAFISYSHKDKKFAKWLHKRIENYKIPKSLREKYPHLPDNLERSVFRDEDELPTASELSDNLLYAMDNSERFIVICSPASVKSKWVNSEIKYYKHKHGENSVLAIIKDGEPNATDIDDAENEAFPDGLRYKVNQEGNLTEDRTEPIAGDARSYFGREMALMKMIAGILKVDFADLWRREKRERKKRWFIALSIISVFIVLSIYASTQFIGDQINKELEKINSDIALIEYNIRHNNLAQETIIELNKELKKLKELKKVKEDTQKSLGALKTPLGREAQEVYKNKGAKEAIKILTSRKALSRKEQLKKELSLEDITLAKLYIETHQFKKAQDSYENAISIFFDYDNVMEYCTFLYNQKHYSKAMELYKKLLELKLTKNKKANIYLCLGNVIYSQAQETFVINKYRKKLYDAESAFQKSLLISRELAEKSLINKYMLALALNNLSVFYRGANELNKAEKLINESLKISKQLISSEKNNPKFNNMMALIFYNKGSLLRIQKEYKQAEYFYNKSLSIYERLLVDNPEIYNKSIAMVWEGLGILYQSVNHKADNEIAYKNALLRYTKMAKNNPEAYCSNFKTSTINLAKLYEKNMNYDEAEITYIKAFNICTNYPKVLPFNNSSIKFYLRTLYYNSKQLAKLEKSYQDFKENNLIEFNANEASILRNLAKLYINVNKIDKAKQSYIRIVEIHRGLIKKTKFSEIFFGLNYSYISNALNKLVFLYKKDKQESEVENVYTDMLNLYKNFKKANNIKYNIYETLILQDIAQVYINTNEIDKAKQSYERAIKIFKGLIKKKEQTEVYFNNTVDSSSLAWTLNRLGKLYEKDKQFDKAEKAYVNALNIYKDLTKKNINTYNNIAWTISRLGSMLKKNKQLKDAEKYYIKALSILPDNYNSKIAYEFDMLGQLYEKNKQFEKAKKVYNLSLSLYEKLLKIKPNVYNIYMSWVQGRLGEVYMQLKQYDRAIEMHRATLVVYNNIKNKTSKIYNNMVWTLTKLGDLYKKTNQKNKAKNVYVKALAISNLQVKINSDYNEDIISLSNKLKEL